MKAIRTLSIIILVAFTLSSCNFFRNIFGGGASKNGCPSNGKNVGAERLVQDNPKGKKKLPKAPKYTMNKF